ncbi:hypothetical protein ASG49_09565 [Marmoricola sp. Leaf446]|uniref:S8 family serine peptidase n=1 Tax=Marmoricola sp. Leaf446 TaxID=1736379 RepID=UPI0006FEF6F9|nr:S8 family serine peptidase [Marmoricola sp. Leaf446]KQT92187.1 hypothetical protein ASG49_09565 [Marmoricola sp. Leaf446]
MTPGARRRAGSLAVAAVLATALSLGVGATTSPAAAAECEIGKTQYFDGQSQNLVRLGIPQTWQLAQGKGVVVAVVDSGVNDDNAHFPDGVLLPGTSFVAGDTDGTGRTDALGHGTAVAGIIAARALPRSFGSGMIGAAPAAQILPVRVFTRDQDVQPGETPLTGDNIARGIRWAVENGADVINVSLSAPSTNTSLAEIKSALALAEKRDVVVVASSGDSDGTERVEQRFPAAGRNVIGVAATNAQGFVDDYSVHGEAVDVAAPGANVLVTFHGNGDCQTGPDVALTSWAAPFVAALAAQLRERFPKDSAEQIAYRILSTAERPVAGQRDDDQGWGVIRPYEALTATFDTRRAGPAAPDQEKTEAVALEPTGARPMQATTDPLDPARREVLWWLIGGGGLAALALVSRPLVARARRD